MSGYVRISWISWISASLGITTRHVDFRTWGTCSTTWMSMARVPLANPSSSKERTSRDFTSVFQRQSTKDQPKTATYFISFQVKLVVIFGFVYFSQSLYILAYFGKFRFFLNCLKKTGSFLRRWDDAGRQVCWTFASWSCPCPPCSPWNSYGSFAKRWTVSRVRGGVVLKGAKTNGHFDSTGC